MNYLILRFFVVLLAFITPALLGCKPGQNQARSASPNQALNKITFDLSSVSADGLIGPVDGLRSLSYEFCIPAKAEFLQQVKAIDPSVQISRSPGRIGCTKSQYLVIGDTHQPQWREVLLAIAHLDYVQKIDQFFGE